MSKECPICGKAEAEKYKPFCCKRCADIDLGKWMKGDYAVPAIELDDVSDEELAMADRDPQLQ
ncbi:MAG: DNA gyrase inhibitor YacG [Rickettsiales bacterium]